MYSVHLCDKITSPLVSNLEQIIFKLLLLLLLLLLLARCQRYPL